MFSYRPRLFEFGDMDWCPGVIKQSITQILAQISQSTGLFRCTARLVKKNLGEGKDIVVLGAGSGGGINDILGKLPKDIKIHLTDILPEPSCEKIDPRLHYERQSLDAIEATAKISGTKLMYDTFHHLPPEEAKKLLEAVAKSNEPFLTFEACERSLPGLIACLKSPFYVLKYMPRVDGLSTKHLFFTYIIPVIPFVMLWDGLVSCLRVYSADEIMRMTKDLPQYHWKTGRIKGQNGEPIRYIAALPRRN